MSEQDKALANSRKRDKNEQRSDEASITRFFQTVGVVAQDPARPSAVVTKATDTISLPPISKIKVSGTINRADLRLAQSSPLLSNYPIAARMLLSRPAGVKAAQEAAQSFLGVQAGQERAGSKSLKHVEPASRSVIQRLFPVYTEEQLVRGRAAVEEDLRKHRAFDMDGRTISVWDKLQTIGLDGEQLQTILNAAACLRENFANHRGTDGRIDPDQMSNWLHTMDELDEVLESTRGKNPGRVVRSAMSMFGDSVKTKRNFMVHNLDGTMAWKIVGARMTHFFTSDDVHGIGEANKEHQIGPPELMARIYSRSIVGALNSQRTAVLSLLSTKTLIDMSDEDRGNLLFLAGLKQQFDARAAELAGLQSRDGALSDVEHVRMEFLVTRQQDGPFVTDEESAAIAGIYNKLSMPFGVELCQTPSGGMAILFEPKEAELFRFTGNEYWYVPHDSTYWYEQSRIGIDADSKANYARIGGFRKLLHLNGPETDTFFQFPSLDLCLESPRCSYAQAWEIMTEEGRRQAETRLSETAEALVRSKAATERWLRAELGLSNSDAMPQIPFWNCDLVYPERGNAETEWWRVHKTPEGERTVEEQVFWQQHRFDGLNEQQRQDYLLAIRIRDHMVDELGREQRVDGIDPEDFKPVMGSR